MRNVRNAARRLGTRSTAPEGRRPACPLALAGRAPEAALRRVAHLLLGGALLLGCDAAEPDAGPLEDQGARAGYSIGHQVGSGLAAQAPDLDPDALVRGLRDGFAGVDPALSEEEMQQEIADLSQRAGEAQRSRHEEEARANLAAGREFLAENGKRPEVTTLASGLQYEVLSPGEGPKPDPKAKVTVHYRGTLIDGSEFDSSYSRNQPASFPLDRVIPGWQEALPLMAEGARWKLFVPADLAYGERGSPPRIPPNASLVFEVELISAGDE